MGIIVIGVGISYLKVDYQRETYSGFVIDSHTNYFILLSKGERLYAYNKENNYEIGDYLTIEGTKEELSFTAIESQFDFQDYLSKKGVYYSLNINNIKVKFSNPIRIKERREKFLSHFSSDSQSLIRSLLFSENDGSEDLTNIESLHLSRLANASGIFIYAYLHFFSFILSYFIKNKKVKITSIFALLPYAIFTFPRFTVIRIIVLEVFKYINEVFLKKKFSYKTIVGIAGLFFLLIDYHLAYQMSFILGFSIPIIISFIRDISGHYKKIKKKAIEYSLMYVFFIPFELKFYNGINPLSMIMQILLSPVFIVNSLIYLLCFYGVPLYGFSDILTKGLSNLLSWFSKISFQINAPNFSPWLILLYGVMFILFCYYKSIEFKPIYKTITLLFLSGLTLYLVPIDNFISAEVCFINVGQGDSCLIRKGTTSVLIDTGGLSYMDVAKDSLIPFLQKKRIYNIDLVITTHNDYDHCGAYDSLNENFYVKRKITEPEYFPISVGGITFNNYNSHISEYSEENDKSLVVGFSLLNKSFLIMGDAPIEVEKNIINEYPSLDVDILKVGHHGSKTSTCEEFIEQLTPDEAIISCGVNNRYGHPHQQVLNILESHNIVIRRTDLEGTICYHNYIFM